MELRFDRNAASQDLISAQAMGFDPGLEARGALHDTRQTSEIILLSGDELASLIRRVDRVASMAERIEPADLTGFAASLARSPHHGALRLAVVASSPRQLGESLRRAGKAMRCQGQIADAEDVSCGSFAGRALESPSCVALFPSEGSVRLGMVGHLLRYPFVRELFECADAMLEDVLPGGLYGRFLRDIDGVEAAQVETWCAELGDIRVSQPAVALASAASLEVLESFGIEPDLLVGHGVGELVAIEAAGALEPEESIRLAALRGRSMAAFDLPGSETMIAVVRAARAFAAHLASAQFRVPSKDLISSSTGAPVAKGADLVELLTRQLARPERLPEAVQEVSLRHPDLWIEVGPGDALSRSVRRILGELGVECMPTDSSGASGFSDLNRVIARAFVLGFPVMGQRLFAHRSFRPFSLETRQPGFIMNPCERPVPGRAHASAAGRRVSRRSLV